jgi:uncharacterized membrane protein HdeD (DUF308 family)
MEYSSNFSGTQRVTAFASIFVYQSLLTKWYIMYGTFYKFLKEGTMPTIGITGLIGGILAIIFGIVIIIRPQIIAWLIGIYLIIIGVLAIIGALS